MPLSIPLLSNVLILCLMQKNGNIYARSFHQQHQTKMLLRMIVQHSVPLLFQTVTVAYSHFLSFVYMVSGARKRAKALNFLLYFIAIQFHTAPCLQQLNSFFFSSMLCSPLMHLMLAVKHGLFSMFSIKCYIWKSFISKVIDWIPVEIGLRGPIILWKMPAIVGFAFQWLSTIDRLIQILCSDCKQ